MHTLSLEELAAHYLGHGGHLLFVQLLRRDAGVKVMQQLTTETDRHTKRERSMNK